MGVKATSLASGSRCSSCQKRAATRASTSQDQLQAGGHAAASQRGGHLGKVGRREQLGGRLRVAACGAAGSGAFQAKVSRWTWLLRPLDAGDVAHEAARTHARRVQTPLGTHEAQGAAQTHVAPGVGLIRPSWAKREVAVPAPRTVGAPRACQGAGA
eukprot:scaffold2177_cov272-Pinguiococcus_pyrenoidosus.AAC.20